MMSKAVFSEIADIVGCEYLMTAEKDMADYATDATQLAFMPDAVAFPENSQQVSQILQLATEKGFPVIPRGAGSGMSGGALPVQGGLVVAMSRFNRILAIDEDNLI